MSSRVLPSADSGTHSGHRGRKKLLGLGMGSAGGVFASLANQRAPDFVSNSKSKIKLRVREDAQLPLLTRGKQEHAHTCARAHTQLFEFVF